MVDIGNTYYAVRVIPDKSREAICQVPNHGDDHQKEDTPSEEFRRLSGCIVINKIDSLSVCLR